MNDFWDASDDQFRLLTDKAVAYCLGVLFVIALVFA